MRSMMSLPSAVAVALAFGGGVALASQDTGTTITACVDGTNGNVRITAQDCRQTEQPLSWNQVGPAGPQGPAGADGPAGPAGQDGIDGVDGQDGSDAFLAIHPLDGGHLAVDDRTLTSSYSFAGPPRSLDLGAGQHVSVSASATLVAGSQASAAGADVCYRESGDTVVRPFTFDPSGFMLINTGPQYVDLDATEARSVSVHRTRGFATAGTRQIGICARLFEGSVTTWVTQGVITVTS